MNFLKILVALIFVSSNSEAGILQESNLYSDKLWYGKEIYETKSEAEEEAEINEIADHKFTMDELQLSKFTTRFSPDVSDEEFLALLGNIETYQGDIILTKKQEQDVKTSLRTGIIEESYRWPKNNVGKVIVPYEISPDYCKL